MSEDFQRVGKVSVMEEEVRLQCPYCWKTITVLVDCSVQGQSYIEDCEICCNPIEITYTTRNLRVESFSAVATQSYRE